MKKLLSIIAIVAIGLSASAQVSRETKSAKGDMQQKRHFAGKHHGQHNMMKALNFSDAQKAQLKTNREAYKTKLQALKQNQEMTLREFNAKKAILDKEQKEKMQALLTPEQKTKMAEMKTTREQEMKARNEKRFEEMKVKLSLSEDQAIKLKAFNESTFDQLKAIRENESLSREEKHEKMKAVKDAAMDQRKTILTADQQKKLEEMKQARKDRMQSKK